MIFVVCVQGLLAEADTIVNDGQWEQLNTLLERVQNQPNFLKGNLRDAMAGQHDSAGISACDKGFWNESNCCLLSPCNHAHDANVLTGLETRQQRQQAEALIQSIREYVDQVSMHIC